MHNSLAIKNLAIAYEALAHAGGVEDLQQQVKFLLNNEITKAREVPPPATPNDDDIPF